MSADEQFLGGKKGLVLTNAADMALVVAVGWDGNADINCQMPYDEAAKCLRELADRIEAPVESPSPKAGT